MDILPILSQPITQFVGLIALVVAAHRAGFDVPGMLQAALGTKKEDTSSQQSGNKLPGQMEALFRQMQTLSEHFNHETTDELTAIKSALEKMHEKQDTSNELLRGIDKYGIKCRKE